MTDTKGKIHKVPLWGTVLHYEQAVRDKAFELMSFGAEEDENPTPLDIATAMKRARKDMELKRVHFIEKFQLQETSRSASSGSASTPAGMGDRGAIPDIKKKIDAAVARALGKPTGKTQGKGRGGGKDKPKGVQTDVKDATVLYRTFEKKLVCQAFNTKKGCRYGERCKFAHVCQICLGTHSAVKHE